MKKLLALTTLSAALVGALPASAADSPKPIVATVSAREAAEAAAAAVAEVPAAHATDAKPAAKPAKPTSAMFDALGALGSELKDAFGNAKGNPIPYLDKLVAHQYSDQTRQKLTKVFGDKQPMTLQRNTASDGTITYVLNAPAFSYLDANATTIAWSELGMILATDKAGLSMNSQGSWRSFRVADKAMSMTISDISLEGKQRRTSQNIWLGKVGVGIGKIDVSVADAPGAVLEGLSFSSKAVRKGTAIDIAYDSQIKTVKVAGEQLDDIRFAMRMLNIDMRALEKMTDSLANAEKSGKTKEQNLAALMAGFKVFGKSVAARGSALEIDDFSVGLHANRAVVKGRVALLPSTDADFASRAKMVNKIVARLQIRVPVAMVTDVASIVMTKQAEAKGETTSPDAIAQTAQSITDVVVGKMLNGGFAKLDNGVLVSLIEFKAGKLTFNGKEVVLPKAPAKPAAAEAPPPDAGSGD